MMGLKCNLIAREKLGLESSPFELALSVKEIERPEIAATHRCASVFRLRTKRQTTPITKQEEKNEILSRTLSIKTFVQLLVWTLLIQGALSASRQQLRNKNCKEYDITSRAFLADVVFEGIARTKSESKYDVTFTVQNFLKKPNITMALRSQIRLHFKDKRLKENPNPYDCHEPRANIKTGSKYFVFANVIGMNLKPKGGPIVANSRNQKSIQHVLKRKGKERTPLARGLENAWEKVGSPLRLNCIVRGVPVPKIMWYKDGRVIPTSSYLNITYHRKKSTIEFKELRLIDAGRYECRARSVTKKFATVSAYVNVTKPDEEGQTSMFSTDTDWPMHVDKCQVDAFCLNGGKCRFISSIGEHMCICEEGYTGARCDIKDVSTREWFPSNLEEELMSPALKRLFRRRIRGEPKLSNADYRAVIKSLGMNKKFRHWLNQEKVKRFQEEGGKN